MRGVGVYFCLKLYTKLLTDAIPSTKLETNSFFYKFTDLVIFVFCEDFFVDKRRNVVSADDDEISESVQGKILIRVLRMPKLYLFLFIPIGKNRSI